MGTYKVCVYANCKNEEKFADRWMDSMGEADLVVVETDSPNMFPVYDPYSALVYSARADNVRDVFVAGRCLVKDRQLVSQDFRQIREDLRQKMNQTAFGKMGNLA